MSGAPIMSGTIQFAKPAKAGMIIASSMMSACSVVIELKNCGFTNCMPGWNSSRRMTIAMAPPTNSMNRLNIKYSVPISL